MGKKISLPIHPGGFSSDVTVTLPKVRPGARSFALQVYQCKMTQPYIG